MVSLSALLGSTAQGVVSTESYDLLAEWNDTDAFGSYVEGRLGSYNVTLPSEAMEFYNETTDGDNWKAYASMVSDIRKVCPLQVGSISLFYRSSSLIES